MPILEGLSVVIPTLNEAGSVRSLVERLHKALPHITHEFIFIDDHSTDATRATLDSLRTLYPVQAHAKVGARGKAISLLEGFALAQYKIVAMIDGDLQYPPEALTDMLELMDEGADVVIANRREQFLSRKRQVGSALSRRLVGKILLGLDYDVQSGLKVFRREILERIELRPSPWGFDMEFLDAARQAGYKIETVDIVFRERTQGQTKVAFWHVGLELLRAGWRVKMRPYIPLPFGSEKEGLWGKGFHYRGQKFVPHSPLHTSQSALFRLENRQVQLLLLLILVVVLGLVLQPYYTAVTFVAILTTLYFVDLLFYLYLVLQGFTKRPEISVSEQQLLDVEQQIWPRYTIFCPLYKEWEVLPQFVTSMAHLDYPKDQLEVLLLLEEDDAETVAKAREMTLPDYFSIVVVPHALPKTKPKACNYGLPFARGEYLVIYDAEDVPDPQQLKKAVVAFSTVNSETVCIQAPDS